MIHKKLTALTLTSSSDATVATTKSVTQLEIELEAKKLALQEELADIQALIDTLLQQGPRHGSKALFESPNQAFLREYQLPTTREKLEKEEDKAIQKEVEQATKAAQAKEKPLKWSITTELHAETAAVNYYDKEAQRKYEEIELKHLKPIEEEYLQVEARRLELEQQKEAKVEAKLQEEQEKWHIHPGRLVKAFLKTLDKELSKMAQTIRELQELSLELERASNPETDAEILPIDEDLEFKAQVKQIAQLQIKVSTLKVETNLYKRVVMKEALEEYAAGKGEWPLPATAEFSDLPILEPELLIKILERAETDQSVPAPQRMSKTQAREKFQQTIADQNEKMKHPPVVVKEHTLPELTSGTDLKQYLQNILKVKDGTEKLATFIQRAVIDCLKELDLETLREREEECPETKPFRNYKELFDVIATNLELIILSSAKETPSSDIHKEAQALLEFLRKAAKRAHEAKDMQTTFILMSVLSSIPLARLRPDAERIKSLPAMGGNSDKAKMLQECAIPHLGEYLTHVTFAKDGNHNVLHWLTALSATGNIYQRKLETIRETVLVLPEEEEMARHLLVHHQLVITSRVTTEDIEETLFERSRAILPKKGGQPSNTLLQPLTIAAPTSASRKATRPSNIFFNRGDQGSQAALLLELNQTDA